MLSSINPDHAQLPVYIYDDIPKIWKGCHIQLQRYGLDKIYKLKVTGPGSRVKRGKKCALAQLLPEMIMFTKFEKPAIKTF